MDKQCPVDGCENILRTPLAMNALSRRDNKTYICGECGTMEGLEIKRGLTPSGGLIIKTETTDSLLAMNAINGHGWSYDLRAISEAWGPLGFADMSEEPLTAKGLRSLIDFANMHHAEDIVGAVYTHGGAGYRANKTAKLKERGLLYWAAELDTSNMARLVALINLYALRAR